MNENGCWRICEKRDCEKRADEVTFCEIAEKLSTQDWLLLIGGDDDS